MSCIEMKFKAVKEQIMISELQDCVPDRQDKILVEISTRSGFKLLFYLATRIGVGYVSFHYKGRRSDTCGNKI